MVNFMFLLGGAIIPSNLIEPKSQIDYGSHLQSVDFK